MPSPLTIVVVVTDTRFPVHLGVANQAQRQTMVNATRMIATLERSRAGTGTEDGARL